MAVLPSWQGTFSTSATMTGCCLTLRERFWIALMLPANGPSELYPNTSRTSFRTKATAQSLWKSATKTADR
jgi:hypothetical protein